MASEAAAEVERAAATRLLADHEAAASQLGDAQGSRQKLATAAEAAKDAAEEAVRLVIAELAHVRRELAASQVQAAEAQRAVCEEAASKDEATSAAKALQAAAEDAALAVEAHAVAPARDKAAVQAEAEAT